MDRRKTVTPMSIVGGQMRKGPADRRNGIERRVDLRESDRCILSHHNERTTDRRAK